MDKEQIRVAKRDLRIERTYRLSLLRSYESKLDRVEPLSPEFEETVRGILKTQEILKDLRTRELRLNYMEIREEEAQKVLESITDEAVEQH